MVASLNLHQCQSSVENHADILRGRELARLNEGHSKAIKAERSPTAKLLLLNAYIRQLLTKIREALKSRPEESGKVSHVVSKIMARAVQIVNYIKTTIEDDPLTGVYFIAIPRCLLRMG